MNYSIVPFDRKETAAPFLIDIPFSYTRTYIRAIFSYGKKLHYVQQAIKVIDSIVLIKIIILKYIFSVPQAVCRCGWLIINASVEAYRACQVYESSLSPQQSQSDSHSALNIKC